MTTQSPPTIAVVGAGIAGLAAAWELVSDADRAGRMAPDVHVYESSDHVGGKLRSAPFAGRRVDLAADAFLGRRPEAVGLCDELGLVDDLVPVGATGASVLARGRLRWMPAGLNVGIPTQWWPLFRSGILSAGEALGVARDLVSPHRGSRSAPVDRSVGDIVRQRLGQPIVERLADPLIGGINAGNVDELSAAVTFPQLLDVSGQPGSLMRGLRRPPVPLMEPTPGRPFSVFWSLPESTASLAELLAEAIAGRGATIHTNVSVRSIDQHHGHSRRRPWQLVLDECGAPLEGPPGESGVPNALEADGVILAVPAHQAASLLASHAPVAARALEAIAYSSVAVVTLSVSPGAIGVPLRGTGLLVPRTAIIKGGPAFITGATYLGRKWPHLARPEDELLRLSVGRSGDERHRDLDDDELTSLAYRELSELLDVRGATPLDSLVTRWDHGFPQYQVGHLSRVHDIDQGVAGLGSIAVAGAAYRGVGIPACIGSGREAARRVLASISSALDPAGSSSVHPEVRP